MLNQEQALHFSTGFIMGFMSGLSDFWEFLLAIIATIIVTGLILKVLKLTKPEKDDEVQ